MYEWERKAQGTRELVDWVASWWRAGNRSRVVVVACGFALLSQRRDCLDIDGLSFFRMLIGELTRYGRTVDLLFAFVFWWGTHDLKKD